MQHDRINTKTILPLPTSGYRQVLQATCVILLSTFLSMNAAAQSDSETADPVKPSSAEADEQLTVDKVSEIITDEINGADDSATNNATGDATTDTQTSISDILVVLDSDGISHTVQHTLATTGAEMTLNLPGSVIPQEVMFFGPDRLLSKEQYKTKPTKVQISSGTAFARYQHQYGSEVDQIQPGYFVLTTNSVPSNLTMNEGSLTDSSISWVFPSEYRLVSYSQTDYNTGKWVAANNTLSFYGSGTEPVTLTITYKKNAQSNAVSTFNCSSASAPSDECSEDNDEDGIPDYRDVCVDSTGANAKSQNAFGCTKNEAMILSSIKFETGKSYLDVTARNALDRVAYAILNSDNAFFEIGGHTDNEGELENNQRLSKQRADAVRHYLLLKGVSANAVRATGYGEEKPVRSNDSAEGRRANRRIELVFSE